MSNNKGKLPVLLLAQATIAILAYFCESGRSKTGGLVCLKHGERGHYTVLTMRAGVGGLHLQSANKFHGKSFPATAKYKIGKIGSVILTVE